MPGWSRLSLAAFAALPLLAGCSSMNSTGTEVPPPTSTVAPIPGNAAVSGSTAPSTTPAGVKMSTGEVTSTLSDHTVTGTAANGQPYVAYFASDGTVRFRQGSFVDTGRWHVSANGQLCSQMAQMSAGTEQCYDIYKNGTRMSFANASGRPLGTFNVENGNPQNL